MKESKTLQSYRKVFKRFGAELTTNDMDYQDSIQDAMVDNILKCREDLTIPHLKHEAKCNFLNAKEKFARYDLTENNLENEVFNRNTGEVLEAKNAISGTLEPLQAEIVELYGQGYTFGEIAALKGLNGKMAVKRIYNKASKAIDALSIAYLYDSRYAIAQFRGKRDKPKFGSIPETNGETVKRKYLCLDQTKPTVKTYKPNYDGDMSPMLPKDFEVIDFVARPFSNKIDRIVYKIAGSHWQNSEPIGISHNKEYIQIMANEAKYQNMINSSYQKPKPAYRFGNGKHISLDGQYVNI